MKNNTALPQKKLRLLGNLLLVVAGLGLILVMLIIPTIITLSSPSEHSEFAANFDEQTLPDGITGDTTVRELLEKDRAFFDENRGKYRALSLLAAAFVVMISAVFFYLALAWRQARLFDRSTIFGLRGLGILLICQFFLGWAIDAFIPRAAHQEIIFDSEFFELLIVFLVGGAPILSSGVLFLILSWVLDYSRKIKEEQALTI